MKRSSDHNCEWVEERIDPYLDEELHGVELAAFDAHVEGCQSCRSELSVAQQVLVELQTMPQFDCPDEVVDSVLREVDTALAGVDGALGEVDDKLQKMLPGEKWWRWPALAWLLRPALAATFAIALVAAAVYFVDIEQQDQPTAAEVAEAEAQLKWTLAYLGDVNRRSGIAVLEQTSSAGATVNRAMRSALGTVDSEESNSDGGSI